MKRARAASAVSVVFWCALQTTGCGPDQRLATVRVSGASTVYPIVQMAGEVLRDQKLIRVDAQAGGSTRGFEDTLAGRNDFGAMARELTEEERLRVKQFPIAFDGVGIVVHRDNPVTDLRTEDLGRIYRKEITNWRDLGGADRTIEVVAKAEGHATLEVFLAHTGLARREVKPDVVSGDNAQVIRIVAGERGAVGYVSMGEVLHAAEIGMPVRLVRLNGVEPTLAAVEKGHFPMFRTLYLVSLTDPEGPSRVLLDFLGSAAGRAVIERGNYVPIP